MPENDAGVKKSPMERMAATCATSEIWWDSSPLVFDTWTKKTVAETPVERRAEVMAWHKRYYMGDKPLEQLFRGVTTNPPLSWAAVQDNPAFWREWAIEEKRKNPKVKPHEVWWMMYKEIVRRGAEKYFGVFNRSGHAYGYLSGQVDPRDYQDEQAMKAQALEIAKVATNIMVKVPGTAQGVKVIKFLTSKGISTNATLCFTVPQYVAVANAVKEGVQVAKKKGVNLKRWRSVITAMAARYEEMGSMKEEAAKKGIELTPADIRWSSIATVKFMLHFLRDGKYPSKMLLASMREGPVVDGKMHIWHFEKLAGADVVYTCPGKYIKMVDDYCYDTEFDPDAWKNPVPEAVLSKLMKLKYFRDAYEPDGLEPLQFNKHPSTLGTGKEFSSATNAMEKFVADSMKNAGNKKVKPATA